MKTIRAILTVFLFGIFTYNAYAYSLPPTLFKGKTYISTGFTVSMMIMPFGNTCATHLRLTTGVL